MVEYKKSKVELAFKICADTKTFFALKYFMAGATKIEPRPVVKKLTLAKNAVSPYVICSSAII